MFIRLLMTNLIEKSPSCVPQPDSIFSIMSLSQPYANEDQFPPSFGSGLVRCIPRQAFCTHSDYLTSLCCGMITPVNTWNTFRHDEDRAECARAPGVCWQSSTWLKQTGAATLFPLVQLIGHDGVCGLCRESCKSVFSVSLVSGVKWVQVVLLLSLPEVLTPETWNHAAWFLRSKFDGEFQLMAHWGC